MLDKLLLAMNDCALAYNQSEKQYVFISPNTPAIIGVTADELKADTQLLQKIAIITDVDQVKEVDENIQPEELLEMHYRIKVNGKIKWFFEKRTRFINEDGHDIVLSVIKDVSDEAAINNHLRNSLGDFSILFEKSLAPMWIYETPSLRIIKVNQAAIDNYGYTEEEFLGMTIRDIRPRFDLAAFNEYIFKKGITRGVMHGHNNSGIWRHQNKNGEIIYAEVTGHEMKYNNTTCRIVIATNVTEKVLFLQEKETFENRKNAELQRQDLHDL